MEALSTEEAFDLLRMSKVAHLGVIAEGEPYVTPMSFVLDNGRILFRTQPGRKLAALKENPQVCIEVSTFDEETGDWASVVVMGSAKQAADRGTGEKAVQLLFDKYAAALGSPMGLGGLQPVPGLPHVMEVVIEEISGLCSGSGFSMRTRPGRL